MKFKENTLYKFTWHKNEPYYLNYLMHIGNTNFTFTCVASNDTNYDIPAENLVWDTNILINSYEIISIGEFSSIEEIKITYPEFFI